MKTCANCDAVLGRRNKTGLCRRHLALDPAWQAVRQDALRRRLATDPELKAQYGARLIAQTKTERHKRRSSEFMRANEMWNVGAAAQQGNVEILARRARAISEARLAAVPVEYREMYRDLTTKSKLLRADALAMVLEQQERDMRKFRTKLGVVEPAATVVKLRPRLDGWKGEVQAIAEAFGTNFDSVIGPARFKPLVAARAVLCKLWHDRGNSYNQIATRLGYAEHSTAMHLVKTWDARIAKNPLMAEALASFQMARAA